MAKTLMLMRHGSYDDFTCSLSGYGQRQVDDVARQMVEQNLVPDVIVHSPVKRAVETAQRVRDVFNAAAGKDVPLIRVNWLHEHADSSVADVQSLDDIHDRVLLVSHMPNTKDLLRQLALTYPSIGTANVFVTTAENDSWKSVTSARLTKSLRPV